MSELEELKALLQQGYLVVSSGILNVNRENKFYSDIPPNKIASGLKCVILHRYQDEKIAGSKLFYFSEPVTAAYLQSLIEEAKQWSHYSITFNIRTISVPGLSSGVLDVKEVIPCVQAYIGAEPLTYEPIKGTLTFALEVSRDAKKLADRRGLFADLQKALSIYYRRGFFISSYQQVEKTRGIIPMLTGELHEILTGFSEEMMDELLRTIRTPSARAAVNYLYNFYLEPTIVGRIIVGSAALEELFGQKDEPERLFSRADIKTLRRIIRNELGAVPAVYERLAQRMADPMQFPKVPLYERIKNTILLECDMQEAHVVEGLRKLRDGRNTVAHEADIGTFDYRSTINFLEEVLRKKISLVSSRPLYAAIGGPLVNPLGTYTHEIFVA